VPQFHEAGPEARSRLAKRAPRDAEREPIRQAIRELGGDQTLELILDEGESMRKLKLLASRAAKEAGTLLVWLADAPNGRRRRRRKQADPADSAAQGQ
jgi:hypothetical protein